MKKLFDSFTKLENFRLYLMHIIVFLLFAILVWKLFSLQITQGDYYSQEVNGTALRDVKVNAPRGTIYDRFGRELAINSNAYAVCLDASIGVDNINIILSDLIDMLEKNNEKIVVILPITSTLPYEFLFSGSLSQENRWKADMNLDKNLSAEKCIEELLDRFNINKDLDIIKQNKLLALRCELYKKRYSKYIPIPIAYNISDKTVATLQEQGSTYPCAYIDNQIQREYPYGQYLSHILGYIGNVTDEDIGENKKIAYDLNDKIGKDGIEKAFESNLRGVKGNQYIEVDSTGRRISILENEGTRPVEGNDIFLTLDATLQKVTYDAIEDILMQTQLARLSGGSFGYTYNDVFKSMIKCDTIRIKNILNSNDNTTQGIIKNYILTQNAEAKNDIKLAREILLNGFTNGSISNNQLMFILYEQGQINDDDILTSLKEGKISANTALVQKMQKKEITPQMTAMDPCTASVVVTDINTGGTLAAVSYPSYDNNELVNTFNNEYYLRLQNDPTTPMVNRPFTEPRAPGSIFKMITALAGLEEGVITPTTTIYDGGTFTEAGTPYARCWIGSGKGSHGSINVATALEVSCNYFFYQISYKMGIGTLNKYMEAVGLNSPTGVEIYELYHSMTSYPSKISSPDYKTYITNMRQENPSSSDLKWTAGETIRTAIGQSYNNYTTAIISKYIATIANGGNRYKSHLLSSVVNNEGKIIEEYEPIIEEKLNIKKENMNAILKGMNLVTNGSSGTLRNAFRDYEVQVGAKSGTAQESSKRSEHTSFVAFAPYDDPQISVAIYVPFGNEAKTSPAPTIAKTVISEYLQNNTTIENRNYNLLYK